MSIYGQHSSSFYVGANGHITLTAGHTDFFYDELDVYFERARVSALYADLNPPAGGTISWKQLSDRAAITYAGVPEFGINSQNSFQFEMFFNGIIRITWLNIGTLNAVVGLSRGTGVPANFLETDPGSYLNCTSTSPALNINRTGNNLRLSWPIAFPIFRLESAANLVPPVSWASVTNALQFTNGFNAVTIPMTKSQLFFRLVTP
jgi:hypothetical protein